MLAAMDLVSSREPQSEVHDARTANSETGSPSRSHEPTIPPRSEQGQSFTRPVERPSPPAAAPARGWAEVGPVTQDGTNPRPHQAEGSARGLERRRERRERPRESARDRRWAHLAKEQDPPPLAMKRPEPVPTPPQQGRPLEAHRAGSEPAPAERRDFESKPSDRRHERPDHRIAQGQGSLRTQATPQPAASSAGLPEASPKPKRPRRGAARPAAADASVEFGATPRAQPGLVTPAEATPTAPRAEPVRGAGLSLPDFGSSRRERSGGLDGSLRSGSAPPRNPERRKPDPRPRDDDGIPRFGGG